ncbi:FHA domain protein [Maioricimonas rarisocia]|uniref:FHA domain protein n=1 Tax=Maioricimonas rarisocia TaxID=2528026 RepID=A0A517Z2Q2_9PLAN|nr:FHA domain-containing protein [Maioricimonas rarisocia]QDU36751.1 FHA domain protein [Maioricimonas rarisocia]
MIAKLIPLDGSPPISITREVTVVGRKRGLCDVILDHTSVSKLHCAIAKTDGLLFIRDLGSTNGTRVNGQRVTRGALLPGDELAFARVKYRVHLGPGEPEAGPDDRTEMLQSQADEEPVEEEEFLKFDSYGDEEGSERLHPNDSQFDFAK